MAAVNRERSTEAPAAPARGLYPPLRHSAVVVSSEDETELESCVICQESRRYLKTIPCGHVFCEYCLQKLVNDHDDQEFPCPMCRARTPVPRGGASGFPINMGHKPRKSVEGDIAAAAAALGAHDEDSKRLCEECGVDMCRFSCLQCQQVVCEWCQTSHEGEDHTLVVLRKIRDFDSESVALNKETCQKHGGRQFLTFCRTCKTPICEQCQQLTHSRHSWENLAVAAARARENLLTLQKKVERTQRCLEAVLEDTDRCRQAARKEKQKSEQEIREKAEQICAIVLQHENAALAQLTEMGARIDKDYSDDISNVHDKLAGLMAIERHLNKALTADSEVELVKTEVNAAHTVAQRNYLRKFTTGLPADVFHIYTQQEEFSWLSGSLRKAVGFPREKHDVRVVPVVKAVREFDCDNTASARVYNVSAATQGKIWVAYKPDLRSTIFVIALFDTKSGSVVKQERIDSVSGLVSIDHQQIFLGLRSSGTGRLVHVDGPSRLVGLNITISRLMFTKGTLRACLVYKRARSEIFFISSLEQLLGLDEEKSFSVCCDGVPQNMDLSADGEILALVDDTFRVQLYRRGAARPYSTFPAGNNPAGQKFSDVCFYRLAGREFLLAADEAGDDVQVLHVKRGCRLVRRLTERVGCLANPTTLNVDPVNGWLLVGCAGGRVVICGDTGHKAESELKHALAMLEIVR